VKITNQFILNRASNSLTNRKKLYFNILLKYLVQSISNKELKMHVVTKNYLYILFI